MSERITKKQKRIVAERAYNACEYCLSQARFSPQPFSVEHIIPRQLGGTSDLDNLALSCQGCNNLKYTKTEAIDRVRGEHVSLYHPRSHQWDEHFRWNEGCTLLLGISPIGRATIDALQLNRQNVVNLRRVLYALGEHPPPRSTTFES